MSSIFSCSSCRSKNGELYHGDCQQILCTDCITNLYFKGLLLEEKLDCSLCHKALTEMPKWCSIVTKDEHLICYISCSEDCQSELNPRAILASKLDAKIGSCTSCTVKTASMRCSKCKTTFYCNATCQKKDWKYHKKSCDMLKSIYEESKKDNFISPFAAKAGKRLKAYGIPIKKVKF